MTYSFEDTGLPNNPAYRKAFERGLKALIAEASSSSVEEAQKSYNHISILPAQIICQLGLTAEKEECFVKTLLNGHSAFTHATNCEVRKLQNALMLGLDAVSLDTKKFKAASETMSPDERLMTQLAIYTFVEDAYNIARETESGATIENAHIYASGFLSVYQAFTRMDYPLVDEIVERKVQLIAEKMATHPAPQEKQRPAPVRPAPQPKGGS